VKYISPQVWASRESRAFQIARDYDLLLSIFPFEKDWYARRVPKLNVEFVGHPMVDRFAEQQRELRAPESPKYPNKPAEIVLLPGSRKGELKRHLPVMLGALKLIRNKHSAIRAKMILPTQSLMDLAKGLVPTVDCDLQLGNLAQALSTTDIAISKTGTITMECAFSGVPTITLYKTSWATYELGKRIVKVKSLTMPNLLANEEVFPEFIQGDATPERISQAALELLQNETRRAQIKAQLTKIVASLGGPGASLRAARAITKLLEREGGVNIKERP
jgi:lipid-A-disaccharide synthase